MKKYLRSLLAALALLFCASSFCFGQTTYDWYGATNVWSLNTNWRVGGVTPAAAPSATNDIIRIGVAQTFTVSPAVTSSIACGSFIFGPVNSTLNVSTGAILTVNNDITVQHGSSGIDGTTYTTTLSGGGAILCKGNFNVGNGTIPPTGLIVGILGLNGVVKVIVNSSIAQLHVVGNLSFTSVSNYTIAGVVVTNAGTGLNDTEFDLNGDMILDGQFKLQDIGTTITTLRPNRNLFNSSSGTANTNLTLNNIAPIGTFTTAYQYLDFYNPAATGHCTVTYNASSGSQTVYTGADGTTIGNAPSNYYSLVLSGASTKVVDGSTLTIGSSLNSSNGAVNLNTNNPVITIGTAGTNTATWTNSAAVTQGSGAIDLNGSLTNSGTMTLGSGAINISGDYTNSATFTQGTGIVTFDGTAAETLTDSGFGTTFSNVLFTAGGAKTISAGTFNIQNNGLLTMSASTTLNANGNLTLVSDGTSSATVMPVPSGSSITGNVKVQRFFKGSSNLSKRGYRLISSPVYTGIPGGLRVFDLNYLLNDAYVTGAAGGGFNGPTGNLNNPSLYIYREDIAPDNNAFTSGNFKGINRINNTPAYNIGTQSRNNKTNTNDTTTNLYVGNGVLFYFRGNKTDNATQTGSKITSPYDYPEDVTFTQLGVLNTGTVNVRLWFHSDLKLAFTTNAGIANSTVRGFCLVGNPYASTINWEKFNRNTTKANSSIYGANIPRADSTQSKIWIFNPSNKQYETYIQKTGTVSLADTTTTVNPTNSVATGAASNMIASGQGFFIRATATNQSLSFREAGKTATQPTPAKVIQILKTSAPNTLAQEDVPDPLLRLKLSMDTINNDEVVLCFKDNAKLQYDDNLDAEDLGGNGAMLGLSLLSSDSVSTAVKRLPFPKATAEVIPVVTAAVNSGLYKLDLTEIRNIPSLYEIWLKDAFKNDSLDIKNNRVYNFNIDKSVPASYGNKRFTLIIRQTPALMARVLNFTGTKTPQGSQLSWTTENEADNTTYTVERSTDSGNTFDAIGFVNANGSNTYTLLDKTPVTGRNQYRLKQVDINDSVTYSRVVTLIYNDQQSTSGDMISMFPNPAVDVIHTQMQITTNAPGTTYKINIVNSEGKVMATSVSTEPSWQHNVSNFLPGTYIMQISNGSNNTLVGVKKFIKK